ncbi:hypothetical protein N7456_008999 [Penicillium angulare]|uniref:Uncharacterized protein n=1 Tax=Penicillium angulare TaxID=116970 RepID=A0A9W9F3S5_9EURO|nr:hypothetical protein N7456_008999 [Penicillium angulare]
MESAHHSRDWSILPEEDSVAQATSVDQATDLPKGFGLDVTKYFHTLNAPESFSVWLRHVTSVLKKFGLEKLIDFGIPRPERDDQKSARWLNFSQKIQIWLSHSLSEEIFQKVLSRGKRIKLADEFMEEVRIACQVPGIQADLDGVSKFLSIKTTNYNTPKEFVWGYKEHLKKLWEDLNIQIQPYLAICRLLNQLDTMENRYIMAPIISNLNKKASQGDMWTQFTQVDFHVTCFNIIQGFEKHGKDVRTPKAAEPFSISRPSSPFHQKPEKTPSKLKHFPPPGTNEDLYAKDLRENPPQLNQGEEHKCAYCSQRYHTALQCFYLNPDHRPPDWKPLSNIWIYKPGIHRDTIPAPTPIPITAPSRKKEESTPTKMNYKVSLPNQHSETSQEGGSKKVIEPTRKAPEPIKKVLEQIEKATELPKKATEPTPTKMNYKVSLPNQHSETSQEGGSKKVIEPIRKAPEPIKKVPEPIEKATELPKKALEPTTSNVPDASETPSLFMGTAFDTKTIFAASNSDWMVIKTTGSHICADKSVMTEYHPYGPDEKPFEWTWTTGTVRMKAHAIAKGKAKINLLLEKGKTKTLEIECVHYPKSRFSMLSTERLLEDHSIKFDYEEWTFHDTKNNMELVGCTVEENGHAFLRTTTTKIKESS